MLEVVDSGEPGRNWTLAPQCPNLGVSLDPNPPHVEERPDLLFIGRRSPQRGENDWKSRVRNEPT